MFKLTHETSFFTQVFQDRRVLYLILIALFLKADKKNSISTSKIVFSALLFRLSATLALNLKLEHHESAHPQKRAVNFQHLRHDQKKHGYRAADDRYRFRPVEKTVLSVVGEGKMKLTTTRRARRQKPII